jgi:hypothetical protein
MEEPMVLRHGAKVLFVAAILALAACGGGSSTETDVGNDVVDALDPGIGDVLDESTGDNVRPDTCTCSTTDACCDGCQPLNAAGACGAEGACLVRGTCQSGVCVGAGPLVCDAPGTCQQPAGTCDPLTGGCVYQGKADSTPCEAVTGKDGSGYCLAAACIGFGECDHRTYDQPLATACNFDGECASGRCAAWGDDWTTYCTAVCGSDSAACPDGMACVRTGAEFLCRPLSTEATLPNDGTLEAFQACNHDADCADALCLGIDGKKFCTKSCDDGTGKASDALCGSCGGCRDGGTALGFKYDFYCVPEGILQAGQPCGQSGDCAKRFCQSGLCSEQCFLIEDLSSCPDNMECVPGVIASDLTLLVCVPKGESGHGFGEPCVADYACKDGRTCQDLLGVKTCTTVCADDIPCVDGTCTDTVNGKLCVPPALLGTVGSGQACIDTFQCLAGLTCYGGACVKGCQAPEDCTDGTICFGDAKVQAYYCTTACPDGTGCPPQMGCFQGTCVLSADGKTFLLGACRLNADCETGACIGGTCTETCSANLPCEGSEPIEPVTFGECQPCNPELYGADCSPEGGFSLNECIQGADGNYFCALNCSYSPVCPVGTRCYGLNGYTSVCAPLSGACALTIACAESGHCVRPAVDGTPCSEDAECIGTKCSGGFCQTGTCAVDADCGCPALACSGGACVVSATFGVAEVEQNDTRDKAQVLPAGTGRVVGALLSTGSGGDVDLYRISLKAGEAVDIRTQPFCGLDIDTYLRLLDATTGALITGWENDDLDPQGDYSSLLMGYVAVAAQDILIEVTQSPLVPGIAKFPYSLELRVFTVGASDTCGGAELIGAGTHTFQLANDVNTYIAPSCTGYAAMGKDAAYKVIVPKDNVLRAGIDTPFDAQLYIVTDCANADGTCLAGADAVWDAGTEELIWWNRNGVDTTVYVIVDSLLPQDDMTIHMTLAIDPVTAPANDGPVADGIPGIADGEAVPGTLVGANGDYDPTVTGCGAKALVGPDVVYKAVLQAGDFAAFDITKVLGFAPALWLTTDLADPTKCVAAGASSVTWSNDGTEPVTVYVIVDVEKVDGYGDFTLTAQIGPLGPTNGPCDPDTYAASCVAGAPATLAGCDANTSRLVGVDCNARCQDNGATSGVCHVFTTPNYERTSCQCVFACDATVSAAQCTAGSYTNCTCASADPCAWLADGSCDQFCATEYPDDHFTDPPADCPPPA